MNIILGGHWEASPPGWETLTEQDQDITKPLKFNDRSVDVIFTEHVLEHISLPDGINFFRESYRVLKQDGVIRIVAPFVDQLIRFDSLYTWRDSKEVKEDYIKESIEPYFPEDKKALDNLGIDMTSHGLPFFLDSLLKKHNHKFVWSGRLMADVLKAIGYSEVFIDLPKRSRLDKNNCIERTYRGISAKYNVGPPIDCESMVVEAKK